MCWIRVYGAVASARQFKLTGPPANVIHSSAHLIQRLPRKVECSFGTDLICCHDLVIEGLDLLNKPCLIERSAIGDDAHGLRHLQGSDLDVALADRHVCDVTVKNLAAMRCLHVFVIRDTAFRFAA